MAIVLALAVSFAAGQRARADQIVLPVAVYAYGANYSLWGSEVRVTNPTAGALSFRVVDFVGILSLGLPFNPATFTVAGGATGSWGAYELLSPPRAICADFGAGGIFLEVPYFGALVVEADAGLSAQSAILTGVRNPNAGGPSDTCSYSKCPSWQGGYEHLLANADWCNQGAGPIMDGTGRFYSPGAGIFLSWLHTHPSRRTNVTFYNPDPSAATVTITVKPADGSAGATATVPVPAHSAYQLNDIFSSPPFDAVRTENGDANVAATATIASTTRLYAIGWVISNENNTVSISVPK